MQQGRSKEETFMKSNIDKSSHWRCSVRKSALKHFANFLEKTLVLESLFTKATLFKKDSNPGVFL